MIIMMNDMMCFFSFLFCAQIAKVEGIWSLYRALPARLLSVAPMIGIQYAIYELLCSLLPKLKFRRNSQSNKC